MYSKWDDWFFTWSSFSLSLGRKWVDRQKDRRQTFFFLSAPLVAAANHAQRRADGDDDENINQLAPENSRIAKLRAAKRHRQPAGEAIAAPLSQIEERD